VSVVAILQQATFVSSSVRVISICSLRVLSPDPGFLDRPLLRIISPFYGHALLCTISCYSESVVSHALDGVVSIA
jgi:hypothetical protein